jgi:2'-5' RNA ligase
MRVAVVAYPRLDEQDREWIEAFRAGHEPQSSRIDAHFTLVFPVEAAPDELDAELRQVAGSVEPFTFTIGRTSVVRDLLGTDHHIFLVPDEGAAEIAALHDRLYAGTLRTHLRADIPFVPHMTVGAAGNAQTAEEWARTMDIGRTLRGAVERVELIEIGGGRVRTVAAYGLGALDRSR